MKKLYGNIVTGAFVMRMNRFVIHAEIDGRMEICHMPNPGRMRELLLVSLDCARHEHGTENHPLCGWKINGYTNKKITIRFI